jgi:hypothetical protein
MVELDRHLRNTTIAECSAADLQVAAYGKRSDLRADPAVMATVQEAVIKLQRNIKKAASDGNLDIYWVSAMGGVMNDIVLSYFGSLVVERCGVEFIDVETRKATRTYRIAWA